MSEREVRRRRRLAEELAETGLTPDGPEDRDQMVLEEIDLALHPPVHERRVASSGTLLEPRSDPGAWGSRTQLEITRRPADQQPLAAARRFADGLSSWLLRRTNGMNEWLLFDRPAGSERDLVVLAGVSGSTLVQRHPAGSVRVVGSFGVLRWEGFQWHHEPPVGGWIGSVTARPFHGDPDVLQAIVEFAVHDLGSLGIGALLIYRPTADPGPAVEQRLPPPPPLHVRVPSNLAPLRHAMAQVDGAAIFDEYGVLRHLGVTLVPSIAADVTVEPIGGTRHTSGRRYSFDDPLATVVVVSEDGPVSVLRNGVVLGRTPNE